ncbi:aminotransferase class I/II-fold pyridoxal phosphate-dependent enzyme [Streptomyces decoyicus]
MPVASSSAASSSAASSSPSAAAGSSDFLQLRIEDAPAGGRSVWLARELRRAIADGRLPVGSRLPATRVLAADLRVSRGVITEAYRRLTEDGQLAGRGRGGTVVVAAPVTTAAKGTAATPYAPRTAAPAATATAAPGAAPFGAPFGAPPGPEIFDELRAAPARIDLSPGVPGLSAFPRTAWLRAERSVLAGLASTELGYGDPRGTPALRRAVANWLARNRGIRADPDEVLIVAGTAQALGLIAQVLHHDGIPEIAVEDPGSLGARQHLRRRHRRRRDAMIAAIRDRLPDATVHGAAAGLHLMVTFGPDGYRGSDTDLAAAALARGVKVQPLSWHSQRPSPPGLVLGYAARTPDEITEGVAVVGKVLSSG